MSAMPQTSEMTAQTAATQTPLTPASHCTEVCAPSPETGAKCRERNRSAQRPPPPTLPRRRNERYRLPCPNRPTRADAGQPAEAAPPRSLPRPAGRVQPARMIRPVQPPPPSPQSVKLPKAKTTNNPTSARRKKPDAAEPHERRSTTSAHASAPRQTHRLKPRRNRRTRRWLPNASLPSCPVATVAEPGRRPPNLRPLPGAADEAPAPPRPRRSGCRDAEAATPEVAAPEMAVPEASKPGRRKKVATPITEPPPGPAGSRTPGSCRCSPAGRGQRGRRARDPRQTRPRSAQKDGRTPEQPAPEWCRRRPAPQADLPQWTSAREPLAAQPSAGADSAPRQARPRRGRPPRTAPPSRADQTDPNPVDSAPAVILPTDAQSGEAAAELGSGADPADDQRVELDRRRPHPDRPGADAAPGKRKQAERQEPDAPNLRSPRSRSKRPGRRGE